MATVAFDGSTRLMQVTTLPVNGFVDLDVQVDVYSAWKEWLRVSDNSKWPQAMDAVGGNELPGNTALGSTFFLLNGWKIRPYNGDHTLRVNGNLYSEDGSSPYIRTVDNHSVIVISNVSTLVQTVTTESDAEAVAATVWQSILENGLTAADLMRLFSAVHLGKTTGLSRSISGITSVLNFRSIDDTKTRVHVEMDNNDLRRESVIIDPS